MIITIFFKDRVSLYAPGCPRTGCVDQAGLSFTDTLLSTEIKGVCHHTWPSVIITSLSITQFSPSICSLNSQSFITRLPS